jgi:flagellar basal-body rod protein FlgC
MSLFTSISVSASGLSAQRARAEAVIENLANAETTRTPEGGPYRRKQVIFRSQDQVSPFASVFESAVQAQGVSVADVVVDQSEPDRRYMPGHPDADAKGYVAFPRSRPAEDMVDLMGATRGYQANVSAMNAVKDMIHRSIDMLR